jgi:FkbM family methyltransferase
MGNFFSNVVKGIGKRFRNPIKAKLKKAGLSWFKIKYLKHLPYHQPGIYNLNGLKVHFTNGPEILHSLEEIFVSDVYNIEFDNDQPYILDCGANMGLATIYLKRRYPKASIVAFEPDKNNFELLKINTGQANWSNIELRQEAIWKEDTLLRFKSEGTLGSKISNQQNDGPSYTEVKACRLRNLLDRKVDFLKLDIEGAEYEVLKDCADRLHMVQYLFIEFHGSFKNMHELNTIFDIVVRAGFSYYIKEATSVYQTPFNRSEKGAMYDLQLNIF